MGTVTIDEADYARLVKERDDLDAQVKRLQDEGGKALEATLHRTVRAFHLKFGHPVRWTPTVPPNEEVRFRLRLIKEEFIELLFAALAPNTDLAGRDGDLGHANRLLDRAIGSSTMGCAVRVDLPEFIDAIEDLKYVLEGTHATFGVHAPPIAAAVHASNMAKDPNGPDGKPVKPEGWAPPDVAGLLREQGWQS